MLQQFEEYVKKYNLEDMHVKYKYNHSIRVEKICEALAKSLNFNDEDTYIMKTIGLLHDIGRFEQYKLTGGYSDAEFDHGAYGAMILFKEGLIEKFDVDPKYYDIMEFAIINHNKYAIEEVNDDRKMLFARVLRDADKLDKFDAYTYLKAYNITDIDDEVTNEVTIQFKKFELINRKIRRTKADLLISIIAFIFDINFKESFDIIYEQKYLDKLYNQINNRERFKEYFDIAECYVEEQVKELVG